MRIFITLIFLALASQALADQTMLARVTAYWRSEGCGLRASSNGARLRNGHCAVDPKRIPYGSKVLFPDGVCATAVDTGPDIVNRRAARACSRTATQRAAIVIDRFFETKADAVAWLASHSQFMNVRVMRPNETVQVAGPSKAPPLAALSHRWPGVFAAQPTIDCQAAGWWSQTITPH